MANTQQNPKDFDARGAIDDATDESAIVGAEIVRQADELIAAHKAKVAELEARRDEVNRQFQVDQRRDAELEAKQWAERQASLRKEIVETENARLHYVENAQLCLSAYVDNMNAALIALERVRGTVRKLIGKGQRLSLGVPDVGTFLSRSGGRLAAHLQEIAPPGQRNPGRIGGIVLSGGSLYNISNDWRAQEEHVSRGIQDLLED